MNKSEKIADLAEEIVKQINENFLVGYGAGECSVSDRAVPAIQLMITNLYLDLDN